MVGLLRPVSLDPTVYPAGSRAPEMMMGLLGSGSLGHIVYSGIPIPQRWRWVPELALVTEGALGI